MSSATKHHQQVKLNYQCLRANVSDLSSFILGNIQHTVTVKNNTAYNFYKTYLICTSQVKIMSYC